MIDAGAGAAARREIERRLLREDAHRRMVSEGQRKSGAGLVAVICVAVVALAVLVYGVLGSPYLPDQPLAARLEGPTQDGGDGVELRPLVARAEARAQNDPFDRESWVLLANAYAFANRYDDAANAMAEAVALDPEDAGTLSALGEFVTLSRGGVVTPAARMAFARALAFDPTEPVARYYEGVARAQDGDITGALRVWRELLADSAPDASWIAQLQRHIADAETMTGSITGGLTSDEDDLSGSTQEDIEVAAEMTEDGQVAMIRGMIDGLAERLQDEPDNLEGWLRLAQPMVCWATGVWRAMPTIMRSPWNLEIPV